MTLSRLSSARDFFRVWFFWKNYAIFIFFLIVAIVMGFAYLATPQYEATAKILILPQTGEGIVISSGQEASRISEVSTQDINTEIELLTSEEVMRETILSFMKQGKSLGLRVEKNKWYQIAIRKVKSLINDILLFLKLTDQTTAFEAKVNLLKNSISVEPVALSNIILVTLKAETPQAAAAVLNRLLSVYINYHSGVYFKNEGADFYGDEAQKFRKKLEAAEKQLKEFQAKWHIVDIEAQNRTNIEQLAELKRNLQLIEITIAETENRIKMLKAGLQNGIVVTREMKAIPAIVEIEKALVPLYIERSEILKSYTRSSREYINIDHQIRALQGEIRNEVKKAIATEQLELSNLRAKKKSLSSKIADLQWDADQINQKEKQLKEMEREIALLQKNYMLYSSKREDSLIFSERKKRNLANVTIADRAKVPSLPSSPNKLLFLILSIFVGLVAAVCTPFFLEFIDHRIKYSHDIEEMLSLPVISSIPAEK